MADFALPHLGENINEADVLKILVAEGDRPDVGTHESDDAVEGRRLARAVGTEETDDLAAPLAGAIDDLVDSEVARVDDGIGNLA